MDSDQGEATVAEAQWRRAAAYVALQDAQGRLLLTRVHLPDSPDDGKWTMPGGGMDWGEDPKDTAKRELLEEAGLVAEVGPVLGLWSKWFTAEESWRDAPGHVLGIVFEARNFTAVADPVHHEGTTDGADWFTLDQVGMLPRVPLVDFVVDLLAAEEESVHG
jgi:8-oxo-dGTP diphosphatase